MQNLKNNLIFFVVVIVGWLLVRATVFPHVEADGEIVSIPPLTAYQICYEPNFADRKMVVDLTSVNGQPLEVGIVMESLLQDSIDDSATFARAAIPGSHRPSLVSGSTEGTTESGLSDSWCLLAMNRSLVAVNAEITMKLYFRL